MNKPQWENAPDWANYLAMDANGEWNWFEIRPVFAAANHNYWDPNGARFTKAGETPEHCWKNTREGKP